MARRFITAEEAQKEGRTTLVAPQNLMFTGDYPCMMCFTKKAPTYTNRVLPSIGHFDGYTCPNCKARTSEGVAYITDANWMTTCNKTGKVLVLWTTGGEE
jgi:hypothetical protein